jgi:hypothetical protein
LKSRNRCNENLNLRGGGGGGNAGKDGNGPAMQGVIENQDSERKKNHDQQEVITGAGKDKIQNNTYQEGLYPATQYS